MRMARVWWTLPVLKSMPVDVTLDGLGSIIMVIPV